MTIIVAADNVEKEDASTAGRASAAGDDNTLSFLARLSGRRRQQQQQQQNHQLQHRHVHHQSSSGGGGGRRPGVTTTVTAAGSSGEEIVVRRRQLELHRARVTMSTELAEEPLPALYHCCRCAAKCIASCCCGRCIREDYCISDCSALSSSSSSSPCCAVDSVGDVVDDCCCCSACDKKRRAVLVVRGDEFLYDKCWSSTTMEQDCAEDCRCAADASYSQRIRPEHRPHHSRDHHEIQRNPTTTRTSSRRSSIKEVVRRTRSSLAALSLPSYLATLLLLSYSFVGVADACSSRSTPKPRPPTPTPRPNITFHMYACPPDYAEWYCLNGATCFTVKIVDSLLYNCLCANGYIGQRCEFKDLDGSYMPYKNRIMLEQAGIAGAVTIAVFLAVITFISVYIHCKRKQKELSTSNGVDAVDGPAGRDPELRPFCSRSRSLMIFMAKNPNSSTTPSIEQTRMPNWNYPCPSAESSTRLASVNENVKRTSQ